MGVTRVYGSTVGYCPDTIRVLASLFDHQLEFQFIPVDLQAGDDHFKEFFLSLSPFEEVPVLHDDDLVLFESRAIMRYISHYYPKPGSDDEVLVYENPKLQGIAAAWIDVEDHEFEPVASKLIQQLLDKKKKQSGTGDGVSVDVSEEETELGRVLDVYEERLKECKYLGGDKFTSADLSHLPYLYYLMTTPARRLFDERPCVRAWCGSIMARPAWAKLTRLVSLKQA